MQNQDLPVLTKFSDKIFKSLLSRVLTIKSQMQSKSNTCPICEKQSIFLPFGVKLRENALCPVCFSLERHRFFYLLLQRMGILQKKNIDVLHFAPEKCFEQKFEKIWREKYITVDLFVDSVKVKADITDLPFKNKSFDLVICSHVLEHIENDDVALRELSRVLKKDGILFIMVPTEGEHTYEDSTVKTPEERLSTFGQKDHVRIYGMDITKRIKKVGLKVEIVRPVDLTTKKEIEEFSLKSVMGSEIFLARKI